MSEEKEKRGGSLKVVATIGALLVALVVGLYGTQNGARGEYNIVALGTYHGPLVLEVVNGLPRWGSQSSGGMLWQGYFVRVGPRTYLLGGPSIVSQGDHYYGDLSRIWAPGTTPIFERFPLGALVPLREAVGARDWEKARDEAERLQRELPDRVSTKYFRVATLIMTGDTKTARSLYDGWAADFRADPSFRGALYAEYLDEDFLAATPEEARSRDFVEAAFPLGPGAMSAPSLSYDRLMEWFVERGKVTTPRFYSLHQVGTVFNFLQTQTSFKIATTRARMLAFDGRFDEAHALLLGVYRGHRMSRRPGTLIEELISIAVNSISLGAMRDVYLHGTQSAERLERVWDDYEAIFADTDPGTWRPIDLVRTETPWITVYPAPPGAAAPAMMSPNFDEAITRHLVAEANRQTFRAGLRARHYRAVHGEWPAANAEDELPGPPALDPFDPAGGHVFQKLDGDTLRVYSVGPDATDDGGALVYDPTNGTRSAGDVVVELRAKPQYDYPADPGHVYADEADFLAHYPDGLPPDHFGDRTKKTPDLLKLATDGTGRVWSWGPDVDESGGDHPVAGAPEAEPYDPSNGTTSNGDLWLELHFAQPPTRPAESQAEAAAADVAE